MSVRAGKKGNGNYIAIFVSVFVLIFAYRMMTMNSPGMFGGAFAGGNPHLNPTPTPTPGGPTPTPIPTPTPNPIPHGNKGFSVSSRNPGPRMGRGTITPYDPAIGTTQSISINVSDSINPVTSVGVIVQTDHATTTHAMSLTSGTTSNGVWTASWTVTDSYNYTYKATLSAGSASGINAVTMTLR